MIRSVLIIDDEPADRLIATRILKKAGLDADIHEFPDGQSALAFIDELFATLPTDSPPFRPSTLALVDINMPRLNGFEFLERLEESIRRGRLQPDWIAVMMFSSSNNMRDRARAEQFDIVSGFKVKPLTVEDVQSLMDEQPEPTGDPY